MKYRKITMWVRYPDDLPEESLDVIISDAVFDKGRGEVIEVLGHEDDGLYSDADFKNKELER